MKKYLAYYRVSTKRQGESGLGLDAQRRQVSEFIRARGAEILDEYIEIESGANDDRPQLQAALAAARLYRAPLLIAKLDRLSRSAAFLMTLQESEVEFTCADMPDVCDLTIGVMALMARQEREAISARTKAALGEAKARGVKLGGRRANHTPISREDALKGREANSAKARERAERYRDVLIQVVQGGANNGAEIAQELTRREVPTPRGKSANWQSTQVLRLMRTLKLSVRKILEGAV